MKIKKLKNIHPGEILLEEFLHPMKISPNALARDMGVAPRHTLFSELRQFCSYLNPPNNHLPVQGSDPYGLSAGDHE